MSLFEAPRPCLTVDELSPIDLPDVVRLLVFANFRYVMEDIVRRIRRITSLFVSRGLICAGLVQRLVQTSLPCAALWVSRQVEPITDLSVAREVVLFG